MVCALVLVVLGLSSCDLFGPPLAITVSFAPGQYEGVVDNNFPVWFPSAADIDALQVTAPGAEVASSGPTLGGTIAKVQMNSNQRFFVTGVRIENVRYRLSPADGNPIGTSSDIEYVHPVLGVMSPIVPNLGIADAESAVVEIAADADQVFEVGLASALSMWNSVDADRDNVMFPDDDDEVVEITCSLFFEGYLENGMEFTGAFPPPLLVHMTVSHAL